MKKLLHNAVLIGDEAWLYHEVTVHCLRNGHVRLTDYIIGTRWTCRNKKPNMI